MGCPMGVRIFDQLTGEVFGPVLHVLRLRQGGIATLIDAINAAGYGLTHGIQTRIDETIETVCARIRAGNIYVNRSVIGAVVGVQPFGGEGLSGTGPKAGGPNYLRRLIRGGNRPRADGLMLGVELAGPTGESNTLYLLPRGRVACMADSEGALLAQARIAIEAGNVAVFTASPLAERVCAVLADARCEQVDDVLATEPDAVLFAGTDEAAHAVRSALAAADGKIVPLLVVDSNGSYETSRLTLERTVTINTTASGGNASLLSLAETEG